MHTTCDNVTNMHIVIEQSECDNNSNNINWNVINLKAIKPASLPNATVLRNTRPSRSCHPLVLQVCPTKSRL